MTVGIDMYVFGCVEDRMCISSRARTLRPRVLLALEKFLYLHPSVIIVISQ